MKHIGTISRGIKAPIIKDGDNLIDITFESVMNACKEGGFELHEKDVVAVTESIVARSQKNYITVDDIAYDVNRKIGAEADAVGLILPILSRNRFSLILKGIAKGVKKLIIQLSYPQDEVGNPLLDINKLDEKGIDPFVTTLTEKEFYDLFGEIAHPFTGVDYIQYYKSLGGENCQIILANNPKAILEHTKYVINADIHTRKRTKKILLNNGAKKVLSLDEIMNESINGSGFHAEYGLLGSNLAKDNVLKLFPRDTQEFAEKMQAKFLKETGVLVECMVYGDGAFKDPVGGIWELADPVVSPGFTSGLNGTPNEIKLKYFADNAISDLRGKEAEDAMKKLIKEKKSNLTGSMASQGTTPRRLTDLLGSLCDLTSGSGDKGTPIILIQNYFDNYASN